MRSAENATPPPVLSSRGAAESGSTAVNPTPNRPTDPASSRFADARSAASAATPAASSGAPVLATRSSLAADQLDLQPAGPPGGAGRVGRVLGQLDQPGVGVPVEAQVLLDVGVLAEPGGRAAQAASTAARSSAVPKGSGTDQLPTGSRSTPSS